VGEQPATRPTAPEVIDFSLSAIRISPVDQGITIVVEAIVTPLATFLCATGSAATVSTTIATRTPLFELQHFLNLPYRHQTADSELIIPGAQQFPACNATLGGC